MGLLEQWNLGFRGETSVSSCTTFGSVSPLEPAVCENQRGCFAARFTLTYVPLLEQIFCLPIPEKAKRQHNFIVIPRNGDGVVALSPDTVAPEPLVWTFVEATGKEIKEGVDPGPKATANAINEQLAAYGKKVVFPDENEFASAIPEPHRKNEKAYHVKGFRGSKDGLSSPSPIHNKFSPFYSQAISISPPWGSFLASRSLWHISRSITSLPFHILPYFSELSISSSPSPHLKTPRSRKSNSVCWTSKTSLE
jgi:hypothetical protein